MRPLEEVLENFDDAVEFYDNMDLKFVRDQVDLGRKLVILRKELGDHKVLEHSRWMSYKFQSSAKSNAAQESEADMKAPELYKLREVLRSCERLIDQVRQSVSVYKTEI